MSMHETTAATNPGGFWPGMAVHQFNVEQFHQMARASVLAEDDRVELLDGWIADMNPIRPEHAYVVDNLRSLMARFTPQGWCVYAQQPITLKASEPIPDIVIVRGANADYKRRHPGAGEIGLVVEVADSSLELDRNQKARIYAEAGAPEYWIINLTDRQVEVHSRPRPAAGETLAHYEQRAVVAADGELTVRIDGAELGVLSVSGLLP